MLMAGGILCFIGYAFDETHNLSNIGLGVVLFVLAFVTSLFEFKQEYNANAVMASFKN